MSLNLMLSNLYFQDPLQRLNPMNLSAMLNADDERMQPKDEVERTSEDGEILPTSPMNNDTTTHLRLPSIILSETRLIGSGLSQSEYHSRYYAGSPLPSMSHSLQTPHALAGHTYKLERLHLSCSPRAALSSRQRFSQERQLRDPYWDLPLHKIRTSKTPLYQHSTLPQYPRSRRRSSSDRPHSNKPYTKEQVDCMRYLREDGNQLPWPVVLARFRMQFPEFDDVDLSVQCLSSRLYRANKVPVCHSNGELVLDSNGKVMMVPAKVRDRNTPAGKHAPYRLVDSHPDFALLYDWVHPADKAIALGAINSLEAAEAGNQPLTGMYLSLPTVQKNRSNLKIARQKCQQSLRKIDLASPELAALRRAHAAQQ